MDAGLSVMTNQSARAQMRNQLLQNDIGTIDISQEVPNQPQQRQPPRDHYGPMPYGSNQQPVYMPQQYSKMPSRLPMHQPYAKGGPRGYGQEESERRAYSLNQKSLSNFFKPMGSRLPYGKNRNEYSKDDEEEVMVDEGTASTLTYNDIRTSGNKGGDRYGYGGDTAPIIPTLVTREHGNMSNIEYRKHMTAQKKMAMNAMAKQQKSGMPDARAMSLQSYNSGSPLTHNQIHPQYPGPGGQPPYNADRFNSMVQPPYNSDRSNSMMHGPPHLQQRQQRNGYPPYGPPRPGPAQVGGPRAMSLMTPYSMPPNMGPQMYHQQPKDIIAAPQVYQQPNGSSPDFLPRAEQRPNPRELSSNSSSSNVEHSSSSSSNHDFNALTSPMKHQISDKAHPKKGQLNVLQLSAPQQNDLKEKERLLEERERELKEKERLIKEQEAQIQKDLREKEERKIHLLEVEKTLKQQSLPTAADDDLNLNPSSLLETGLNSLSLNENNRTTNPDLQNRVSTATFVSAFSNSPEKLKKSKSTGMYQLERNDDNAFVTAQEFPKDLHPENEYNLEDKNRSFDDMSNDSFNDGNSTLQNFKEREQEPVRLQTDATSNSSPQAKTKKRSSLIKAKDLLRRQSTNTSTKENDPQYALRKTPSRVSIGSLPNSELDTFHYKQQSRKETDQKTSAGSFSSKNRPLSKGAISTPLSKNIKGEDELAQLSESQDDPDAFIFDNTVGKPYIPTFGGENEIVEADKFKTITISGEQLSILTENKELMGELTMVSMELAESIKRETVLEEQLRTFNQDFSQDESQLSLADFEIELRKKSSKIVELIQQLNDERLKRFIAEEQVLLHENGVKPSSLELLNKIKRLENQLQVKDDEISKLKEQNS